MTDKNTKNGGDIAVAHQLLAISNDEKVVEKLKNHRRIMERKKQIFYREYFVFCMIQERKLYLVVVLSIGVNLTIDFHFISFIYSLFLAKLATYYTIFYFFLGCFFVALVYIFASILDRTEPRYHNTESTMAVRSTSAVVGMGFRPQPVIDDSLIRISNDKEEQARIASSLRLFRDVYLIQGADAKTENCSEADPASDLPAGTACAFNWFHIVNTNGHPCSDNNMYGFKREEPCVLVKLNKVYGWKPVTGALPVNIQKLRGIHSNKSVQNSDVYITCEGTNAADNDVLTDMTYYSLRFPSGSQKFGVIPNYYFPYRNAKDHVQPFILVQFHKLPLNRLVSVTCRAWAPGIEHNVRGMRGMVSFQLYRTKTTEAK
ncbi:hypothetical protein I4U23_008313 [Adineta vaga]|nr:hypothetical protein I4U23_008313 [Adineta vaga]